MTFMERDRTEAMIRWCCTVSRTQSVVDRKKDLISAYRRHLLSKANTFEAMVIKTLIGDR